jgi:ATP-dependent RNA helicase RhlE
MAFSSFGLHPDLVRGVKELGFTRPTPIQTDAIPPAVEGRDILACAMTGSGKTAAFILPILHRLMERPRGRTRALVITPTRELAAQIEQHLSELAVHTPLSGAAIFGGVAMGPQEHALRSGVDVIIATPGRLLDHFRHDYARLDALEVLVLDEADRMLDMGFLPDIRKVLKHLPTKRQTMLFSATMPAPIMELARELQRNPATINLERKAAPAVGITQALYPVSEALKAPLFLELIRRGDIKDVIVFTRTKHRANRLAEFLERGGVTVARIHGNRSQAQRTLALDGFKRGEFQVLVATDIVARGIDIEELSHVVNFDVPHVPEDYIHRVGRTARADATGDAFTFVAPDEEQDLRAIERAVGRSLPRITVSGFDYTSRPAERFEVPIGERIAAIRARRAEERKRAKEKAERRAGRPAGQPNAKPAPRAERRPDAKVEARSEARPKPDARDARSQAATRDAKREKVRGAWTPERPAAPAAPRSRPAGAGAGAGPRSGTASQARSAQPPRERGERSERNERPAGERGPAGAGARRRRRRGGGGPGGRGPRPGSA